jgi:hypothetical protein
MRPAEFLSLMGRDQERTNYFVICSDSLGLLSLLPAALKKVAAAEDIHVFDAEGITKEKARQIEEEARKGPLAGSKHTHFFLYSLQNMPSESVGPLLKAVEEAVFARFVFQAQVRTKKTHTLMSRSSVVYLPFLSKKTVLTNMRAKHLDAKTADELNLYDGTLDGTIRALGMKDMLTELKRETKSGMRGIAALYATDEKGGYPLLGSAAFDAAFEPLLTPQEKAYLRRNPTADRKKLVVYHALQRQR